MSQVSKTVDDLKAKVQSTRTNMVAGSWNNSWNKSWVSHQKIKRYLFWEWINHLGNFLLDGSCLLNVRTCCISMSGHYSIVNIFGLWTVKFKSNLILITSSTRFLTVYRFKDYLIDQNQIGRLTDNDYMTKKSEEQKWSWKGKCFWNISTQINISLTIRIFFLLLQAILSQTKRKNSCPSWTVLIYRCVLWKSYRIQCCLNFATTKC